VTTLALRGATLVDGSGADPVAAATVVIDSDRIDSVRGPAPHDADAIDLEGCTVLPGLIDAHTHLGIAFELQHHGQAGTMPAAEVAARVFNLCRDALLAGFTTCRDMGGLDGGVVRAIDGGLVRGPRILPSSSRASPSPTAPTRCDSRLARRSGVGRPSSR
jgi:imidazolonepropionase-like amidohydrolase